jgi:DNA-binding Lrp family transcriptional regulator
VSRPRTLAARQALIARLLTEDPERSDNSIARAVGCHHSTVGNHRRRLEAAGTISPRASRPAAATQPEHPSLTRTLPGTPGGALKAGIESEATMTPLRIEAEDWARDRWPWLDETRTKLIADLAAKVEAERQWREEHGLLRNRRHGIVWPVVADGERWARRLAEEIRLLDTEARERERADPALTLDGYLAKNYPENGGGS